MHTLQIFPKDLHICKLTAVNVVDVVETSEQQRRRKEMMNEWKVEGKGLFFSCSSY